MNIYKRLAELIRIFDNIELLAAEIESLVENADVKTLDELADFLQTELEYANE